MKLFPVALVSIALLSAGSPSVADSGRSSDSVSPGAYERKPGPRVAGFRRSYRVHVPKNYDGKTPLPLVVAIHGAFSGARGLERQSGLSKLADEENFIVVYPNGIGVFGLFRHWNSGHCCGKALKDGIDDVGFVLSVLDEVVGELEVDTDRLYLVGYSNGGMLAHRIAAERPGNFVALGVVSGTIGGNPSKDEPEWTIPRPIRPMPIVMFHGRADVNVPYEGGSARGKITAISSDRSAALWVERNDCASEPQNELLHGGKVLREAWPVQPGGVPVVRYSIDDWAHDWPGERFTRKLPEGDPLHGFEAAALIWEFFETIETP